MKCDEAVEFIEGLIDGELNPNSARTVDAHLRECTACRTEYHSIKKLGNLIRQQLEEEVLLTVPAGFSQRVSRAVESTNSRPRWLRPAWATAVIAFCFVVGFVIVQKTSLKEWIGGRESNEAVVEELQAPNSVFALWKEPGTNTTVIWLFDDQRTLDEEIQP